MVPLTSGSGNGASGGNGSGGSSGAGQQQEAGQMTFIDFEYSAWAPRGFDWGNHFCE